MLSLSQSFRTNHLPVVEIRPEAAKFSEYCSEILSAVTIFHALIRRDWSIRFRNPVLALLWPISQNFANLVGVGFVIHVLAGSTTEISTAFPLTLFAGLCVHQFVSRCILRAGISIRDQGRLSARSYFPRLLLPAAFAVSGLLDFGICFSVLLVGSWLTGALNSMGLLLLPYCVAALVLGGVGMAAWLSALDCRFRDFRYLLPFLSQLSILLSPILFSVKEVPSAVQPWFWLHPFAGCIEVLRWSFAAGNVPSLPLMLCSGFSGLLLFSSALLFFRHYEHQLAEHL